MVEEFETMQGKTIGDLGKEAAWFTAHTLLAILSLVALVSVMWLFHPDPESANPKLFATVFAVIVPLITGFLITKNTNDIGRYVWVSGILLFSIVCVWVLDLPTGNGLCEHCGALEKLWRTFFDISNGSGLMSGDGLFIGTWIPLSLFGYAGGSKIALTTRG